MIRIDSPEAFAKWLADGPKRRPKAYEKLLGGFSVGRGIEPKGANSERLAGVVKEAVNPTPPPPKELPDAFDVDGGFDSVEVVDPEIL